MSCIAAAALVVLGASPALSEEWKYGFAGAPDSAYVTSAKKVIEAFNGASGGDPLLEIQLIQNEQEMVQQVSRGRIQIGSTSPIGISQLLPDVAVLGFPYIFRSTEERDFVLQKYAKPVIAEMMEAKGLHLLQTAPVGASSVFCKFDCTDPASLKGQKARVGPSLVTRRFWEALGTNVVQLPLTELWPALEQNLVVASELIIGYYVTTPAVQSAPHYVGTEHVNSILLYFANKDAWNRLPAEKQAAIEAAMPAPEVLSADFYAEADVAKAKFIANGGHYHTLTPEQKAKWLAVDFGSKVDGLLAELGPDATRLYKAIMEGRAAFEKK
jgi:TRAP-type C4-dicarboxylate transport system substrate-binding protein